MSLVNLKHMKGTANILADRISRLKSMSLYNHLPPEEEGQEFGHTVFELCHQWK